MLLQESKIQRFEPEIREWVINKLTQWTSTIDVDTSSTSETSSGFKSRVQDKLNEIPTSRPQEIFVNEEEKLFLYSNDSIKKLLGKKWTKGHDATISSLSMYLNLA